MNRDPIRTTTQELAAAEHRPEPPGSYDIHPAFPLPSGSVRRGFGSLAARLAGERVVTLDGFGGMLWEDFRSRLDEELSKIAGPVHWIDVGGSLRAPSDVDAMIAPFLGGDDPLWGTRSDLSLRDFFAADLPRPDQGAGLTILYGTGAALAEWAGLLVYADVPKNEIQYRSRAGSVAPIGAPCPPPAGEAYKRLYFVDWPALNRHKESLLQRIDLIVDAQRPDDPTWATGDDLRAGLTLMSQNWFRPRPWFEPGPWGGQWIREHIPQLPRTAPNYAWSFELIAPENGIAFTSDGLLLEVSLDMLMFHAAPAVLGRAWHRFGSEFPIRFDFLDTFDGGNLSVQCHPRPEYIRREFGESFTQDETYYILDCEPGSVVWLGFREGIDAREFRDELERSRDEGTEVEVERFVNRVEAHRHDLFLIPHGTIHCSGRDNLVLEISATPYIFTFKMYDWLRRDLQGKLRPINIERAFENLHFDRNAGKIEAEFISRPATLRQGDGWRVVHLPTHPDHFYDVERYEFEHAIEAGTDGGCHVMNLVEGSSIILETSGGYRQRFNYAETFVIPAEAGDYRLINEGHGMAKVVKAFVKREA